MTDPDLRWWYSRSEAEQERLQELDGKPVHGFAETSDGPVLVSGTLVLPARPTVPDDPGELTGDDE
jgi:hypothetical protein